MKKFTKLFFALAFGSAFFSANLYGPDIDVTGLTYEEGIYFPGDPVMLSVTVTNNGDNETDNPGYWVDVYLTPDSGIVSDTNHHLQTFTGDLVPGQSHTYEWVQMMPGNLTGNYRIFAEPSGSGARQSLISTTSVIELRSDQTDQFPSTTLLSRPFNTPDLEDQDFNFNDFEDVGFPSAVDAVAALFNTTGSSETPSISADGRFVAFASTATDLVPPVVEIVEDEDPIFHTPSNNVFDIYIQDVREDTVTLASKPGGPFEFADGNSQNPSISPDGRFVAFHSTATNLLPGGNEAASEIYVYDRFSGELTRISNGMNGEMVDGPSFNAVVSDPDANGQRYVAFESEASNLVPGTTNGVADIFVYNLNTNDIRRVNVTDGGGQALGGHSRNPVISADGWHVAFQSRATNLGSSEDRWDVFVHDRDANLSGVYDQSGFTRTVQMSVGFDAGGDPFPADGDSYSPTMTPDGRYVAFVSEAANLFNNPATGSITLSGRPAEAEIAFPETQPATGIIQFAEEENASGTVTFVEKPQPESGFEKTLEISDGVETVVFEFAAPPPFFEPAPGNVPVLVGATAANARNNLMQAVNNSALTISAVASESPEGEPVLLLENTGQGLEGNDQPIVASNLDGEVEVTGMGDSEENRAVSNPPVDGDELLIDNGLFETAFRFVDGEPSELTDIPIERTARGTMENLVQVIQDWLGMDIPDLTRPTAQGTFLVGPLAENPGAETFTLVLTDGTEQTYQFAQRPYTFDPAEAGFGGGPVTLGATLEQTRANLIRTILFSNDFGGIPSYEELPAIGTIHIAGLPEQMEEENFPDVIVNDGFNEFRFRFLNEFEEDEDDPDFDFENEVIDARNPPLILIVVGDDRAETQARLAQAIDLVGLNITVGAGQDSEGRPAIRLLHNQLGEIGNQDITIDFPFDRGPDDPDDPEEDFPELVFPEGMEGGVLEAPEDPTILTFFDNDPRILHPRMGFELTTAAQTEPGNIRVPITGTGSETLGNLLDRIRLLNIPRITLEEESEEPPAFRLENLIPRVGQEVRLTIETTADPSAISLIEIPGVLSTPQDGATITIDDGVNSPVTFEFDENGVVGDGSIAVPVGQSAVDTRDFLIGAIGDSELEVSAMDVTDEDPALRVVNDRRGFISEDHVLVTSSGLPPSVEASIEESLIAGRDTPTPGESFTLSDGDNTFTFEFVETAGDAGEGNIAIVVGPEEDPRPLAEIFEDLVTAIRDADLKITAVPVDEDGDPSVNLTNWVPGPEGNVFITTEPPEFASFEVEGMTGGGFEGDGTPQVYLHDRDTNQNEVFDEPGSFMTEAISVTELGALGIDPALEPAISADGRYVSFRTFGLGMQQLTVERSDGQVFPNIAGPVTITEFGPPLDPPEEGDPPLFSQIFTLEDSIQQFTELGSTSDIYVRDRVTGVNDRVSVNRFGETPPVQNSTLQLQSVSARNAVMSWDGRYIVFAADNNGGVNLGAAGAVPPSGPRSGGAVAVGMTNRHPINIISLRNVFLHDRKFPTGNPDPDPTFPPRVNLQEPVDGAHLSVGFTHQLRASAFPNSGHGGASIEAVDFLVNGAVIGTVFDAPYTIDWAPDAPGQYSIVARARDNRGEAASSDVATVTVGEVNPIAREQDFVRSIYTNLLGRQPTSQELQEGTSRLENGGVSRTGFVADLMNRLDFEEVLVNAYSAYWVVLGRAPSVSEMQGAVGTIRQFEGLDEGDLDDPPEDVMIGDLARTLGLILLTDELLTSPEFVNGFGGDFEMGQNVDYIRHLYRNLGRSPDSVDIIRGDAIIAGRDDPFEVPEYGRLIYTAGFIGRWFFFDADAPEASAVRIGVPARIREDHRRAAMHFALANEIPSPAKREQLASGDRRNAVRVTLSSPAYLNTLLTFFGDEIQETGENRKRSAWLGEYDDRHFDYGTHTGWIRHDEHGWWYRPSSDSLWTYDDILGSWVWTHEGVYPFLYLDSEDTWLYYQEGGSPSQRWFYFYNEDDWESVEN